MKTSEIPLHYEKVLFTSVKTLTRCIMGRAGFQHPLETLFKMVKSDDRMANQCLAPNAPRPFLSGENSLIDASTGAGLHKGRQSLL